MGIKEILILAITLGIVLTSGNRDSGLGSQDKEIEDMKQDSIAGKLLNT